VLTVKYVFKRADCDFASQACPTVRSAVDFLYSPADEFLSQISDAQNISELIGNCYAGVVCTELLTSSSPGMQVMAL
jgi:hypothetical protein